MPSCALEACLPNRKPTHPAIRRVHEKNPGGSLLVLRDPICARLAKNSPPFLYFYLFNAECRLAQGARQSSAGGMLNRWVL
jgi:hypothetical protein